jgi:hypothetical protein
MPNASQLDRKSDITVASSGRLPRYISDTDDKGFKKPIPAVPASQRTQGKEDKEEKSKPRAKSDKEAQQYVKRAEEENNA